MDDVAAILLAAGLSRRMGAQNKLLMPVAGKPMVRHLAETYLSVLTTPLTVVTGHEANKVRAALTGLSVVVAHNENFAEGQPGSVATGLSVATDAALLLIGLADQPRLTQADLIQLLQWHRANDPGKITVPKRDADRGNPILVPRILRPRLTENPNRPGCMRVTRDEPELVQFAPLTADGFYADVDTPEDYAGLMQNEAETAG
ncbi:nucleotidyltransferase family protein [Rhodobacterales bacterium HKCCA1288]|jgi:molybdenum cofactor cytidylyltransferase|nr:NTP transferase domain-containing protein [Rhodobacterales bacterium HKCCA1058]MBF9056919.1 NTP transferase domain-containing protein [Rhodobacterales bacterium HKCCA1065]QPI86355.1 nucleotidyltransferase family protein [Rhodobacterales bacterium HKCCA1288]